ncbi:hypothetical protein HZA38_05855 [Candidatus Peregrinibacteria bacterium]|nr:hypothetical protein [Candidatus Peregrinibacteria bacterium]
MKNSSSEKNAKRQVRTGSTILKWHVPEYEYRDKGPIWKFLAILLVIGLIIYGIISDSYPFSVVVALFAGVYFLTHKKPKVIEICVTDMGIQVDHRFYEFSNIRNFWILFKPGEVETLNLHLAKNVVKEVSILLGEQDPAELREVLSRFVSELAGKDESAVDWITRKLKL